MISGDFSCIIQICAKYGEIGMNSIGTIVCIPGLVQRPQVFLNQEPWPRDKATEYPGNTDPMNKCLRHVSENVFITV